jgi:cytoskeleton protein RodZ
VTQQRETLGSKLKAARRARGITIERASQATRIKADFLERMERNDFGFLAPAYVRGFVRSYAAYLHLDPDPLMAELDARHGAPADEAKILAGQSRQRRVSPARGTSRTSPWVGAAVVAVGFLALLSVIGLLTGNDRPPLEKGGRSVANRQETSGREAQRTPSPTPSRSAAAQPKALAFNDGIKVTVIAKQRPCWIRVEGDGAVLDVETLAPGQQAGPFTAEQTMSLILGDATASLVVNGRNLGAPGGPGEVASITLPDDIKSLL